MPGKFVALAQVDIRLTLNDYEAVALSQFLKRLRQDDVRARTSSQLEMSVAVEALSNLRRELAAAGFDPR